VNVPVSGAATNPGPPAIFLSYSHKDERWKDRLLAHLGVAAEEGLVAVWNDRRIGAGEYWLQTIQEAIEAARIAVFLISADFLTSRFIRSTEVPQFLERRVTKGLQIFPVIVRSCDWHVVPWLSPLQARPRDGRPLAGFRGDRADAELAAIAKEVREMIGNRPVPARMSVPEAPVLNSPAAQFDQAPPFPRSELRSDAPTGSSDLQGLPATRPDKVARPAGRRRLRLTVHVAVFDHSGELCYFLNATNLSKEREIEITHVWLDASPPVHALQSSRRLPKRLKPDETWETWIPFRDVGMVPVNEALRLGRARLSTGEIIRSIPNEGVPSRGYVPGGPILG
jgi:TIR domain